MFIYSLLIGIATITVAQAEDFLALDAAIPINNDAAKYAPVFDFDTDGCLPSAGISRDGQMNPGLGTTGTVNGNCYGVDPDHYFLPTSNTFHRYACIESNGIDYCGRFYSLYFEKDQTTLAGCSICGHRHDWEHIAVWTMNGTITHVGASAHGSCDPVEKNVNMIFQDDHVMIVYHKDGPVNTHCFRFANGTDVTTPENPHGKFVTPALVSWYELTGDSLSNSRMRVLLNSFDYGSATLPMKDSNFWINLNNFKPPSYPVFVEIPDPPMEEDCYLTEPFSEESGTAIDGFWGQRCLDGYVVAGIKCYGDYCDNKQLMCCKTPGLSPGGPETEEYSDWFSEEATNYFKSDDKAVVGMRCHERYCDAISLILRSASGEGGEWAAETFSDVGVGHCGSGYVAGVACSGSYCDNLRLYCKEIIDQPTGTDGGDDDDDDGGGGGGGGGGCLIDATKH